MKITETDCDKSIGVAWIAIDSKFIVQCDLAMNQKGNAFTKTINSNDCNFDEGLNGRTNKEAFEKYGREKCITELFKAMRLANIKVFHNRVIRKVKKTGHRHSDP